MSMLGAIMRWSSFRRNRNFWDWVRDSYPESELRKLVEEATDCSLIELFSPFENEPASLGGLGRDNRRRTVKALMGRYGSEICDCCLGAGGYDPEQGRIGIRCLSKLDLAS
jgi:hypothetical protein